MVRVVRVIGYCYVCCWFGGCGEVFGGGIIVFNWDLVN